MRLSIAVGVPSLEKFIEIFGIFVFWETPREAFSLFLDTFEMIEKILKR